MEQVVERRVVVRSSEADRGSILVGLLLLVLATCVAVGGLLRVGHAAVWRARAQTAADVVAVTVARHVVDSGPQVGESPSLDPSRVLALCDAAARAATANEARLLGVRVGPAVVEATVEAGPRRTRAVGIARISSQGGVSGLTKDRAGRGVHSRYRSSAGGVGDGPGLAVDEAGSHDETMPQVRPQNVLRRSSGSRPECLAPRQGVE
jgi:hypothetical protein